MHMKKCILAKGVKPMRNNGFNPKAYPYWDELQKLLKVDYNVEILEEIIPLQKLKSKLICADLIICTDSFIQHFCWSIGKQCVVLFGKSDPLIFGHKENINLLKSRDLLRDNQFDIWEDESFDRSVFMNSEDVIASIEKYRKEN